MPGKHFFCRFVLILFFCLLIYLFGFFLLTVWLSHAYIEIMCSSFLSIRRMLNWQMQKYIRHDRAAYADEGGDERTNFYSDKINGDKYTIMDSR